MGYYIPGPTHGKAQYIIENYPGSYRLDTPPDFNSIPEDMAIIVVVNNGPFEAAGYAFSAEEYSLFRLEEDLRPKEYVAMPKKDAQEVSGYLDEMKMR